MSATAIPTLTQIQNWDTQHLDDAANHWQARAHNWEEAFTAVYARVPGPGGTPWEGRAADAALQHVGKDRIQALTAADTLYTAAAAAREGSFQIQGAKQTALQAIQAAQAQSFNVGDDLSVTDRFQHPSPVFAARRQAQAQTHSVAIRGAAADLVSTDASVAGQIGGAGSGLNGTQFDDAVVPSPDDQIVNGGNQGGPHIQMVDNTNTTGPTNPPTPTPGAQPQIGPFPVPPEIAASAPPGPPRPVDPTGGLLTPQNLPPAPPPPDIPGVKPTPPQAAPPGAPPLPSYPDLVNQVNSQGKVINDMQNAQHNVTPGGILGSGLAGCASGAAVGALPTTVFPPADAVSVPGGCVVGAIGGLSSYLATIWGSNAFGGN